MKTPYFVITADKLNANIDAFDKALREIWPNSLMSYSVKTNSLPWLLKYLKKRNIMAEVVSDEEYQLAQLCEYDGKDIVFNGPIKSKEYLEQSIKNRSIINIDSVSDVDNICQDNTVDINRVGIRININQCVFDNEDVGYAEDGYRFGFSEENGELKKIIDKLENRFECRSFGLHLHCNSITRSLNVYKSISRYAAGIITKYKLTPSFIDIGGGFFGGVEKKPTAEQYISVIKKELEAIVDIDKTTLIIEPGSAIIGSAAELHTSVLDVKDTAKARIVTTDGSRINIDPLWKKDHYMFSLIVTEEQRSKKEKQIICGYTCMDHDRIMSIRDHAELSVGDKIVYYRVGAYTMTFGGPFIKYFPEIYVYDKGRMTKIRSRISVKDYIKIME